MFLAVVGLTCGGRFVATLLDGGGWFWMALGAAVTLIPVITVMLVARLALRENYLSLCGLVTGAMTDPPALAFAVRMGASNAPAVTYATVYALAVFLRIAYAQLLVVFFA
jgi:putative transport protein